jgi:flagellar biosynthesis/type III secretory pathway chaperone
MSVQNLIQVMQAQTILMNELAALENRMLAAILVKDAGQIQSCTDANASLSAHLDQAETVRVTLVGRLAAEHGIVSHAESQTRTMELFDRVLLRLDSFDRTRLNEVSRQFRMAVSRLVNINQALRMYTEAQLGTLDSFLTELVPQRSDGVYGANGRQLANKRPQLLNRHA